ncbi:MAG: hypothetical protein N4A36_01915 [Candidatus Gracilibacteria bacterium]|jgi:hypothetical protein|nr:hypothetical protein [Candidatus Gracilibacteria bacterium]
MNQKKFLAGIGFLFILSLAIGGVSIHFKNQNTEKPDIEIGIPQSEAEKNQPEITPEQEEEASLPVAEEEPEEKIDEIDAKQLKEALNKKDESLCHDISSKNLRGKCFDGISLTKALELSDKKICEKITDKSTKEYCIDQILLQEALVKKQYSNCDQIKNDSLKKQCTDISDKHFAVAAEGLDDCEKIKNENIKSECVVRFKMRDKLFNEGACDEIKDANIKKKCEDKLLLKQAEEKTDIALCTQITNNSDQELCKKNIRQKQQTNWAKEAAEKGDAKNCAVILDKELRQKCIDKANYQAMRTYKDISYCEKIEKSELKSACLQEEPKINLFWLLRAEKEKKSSHCKMITDPKLIDKCNKLFNK